MRSEEKSTADVFQDIARHVQSLVHSEIQLAKTETLETGRKAAQAGALLGSGALFGVYCLGLFLTAALLLLTYIMPPWVGAVLLAIATGCIAGALLWGGIVRMKQAHLKPEKTIRSVKETLEWARHPTESNNR
jgi:hypothetical protein